MNRTNYIEIGKQLDYKALTLIMEMRTSWNEPTPNPDEKCEYWDNKIYDLMRSFGIPDKEQNNNRAWAGTFCRMRNINSDYWTLKGGKP